MKNRVALLVLGIAVLLCPIASATTVYISHYDNSFDVVCEPSQDIKAWEFALHYDNTIIELDEVTFGGFFSPYDTFSYLQELPSFITGYELTLGANKTVNTTGSFIHVEYHRIGYGTTELAFGNTGITNETQYIPADWYDSTLSFDPPPNDNITIEGYFSFSSNSRYSLIGDDVAPRWFTFSAYSFWRFTYEGYRPSWFSFVNESNMSSLDSGYFSFQCPPESPVDDVTRTIGNNIYLIMFVIIVSVLVCAGVFLGLQWQRRRRML